MLSHYIFFPPISWVAKTLHTSAPAPAQILEPAQKFDHPWSQRKGTSSQSQDIAAKL